MTHANALLTPRGRLRLARCVVEDGWTYARAAERFQCSTATAKKWADRYRVLAAGTRWLIGPAGPITAPGGWRSAGSDGSSRCASPAAGARTASPLTCGWPALPSRPYCADTRCRSCAIWTRPAACQSAGHGRAATSTPNPEISSTSTSKSSGASPTAVGTASWDARRGDATGPAWVMGTCTTPLMTTLAGLFREPRRRTQRHRCGVLETGQRVLRRPRHHREAGAD